MNIDIVSKQKTPATAATVPGRGRLVGVDVTKRICEVPGCDKPHRRRGMCDTHYARAKRHGEIAPLPKVSLEERFWSKVDRSGECWVWTKFVDKNGYGSFYFEGKPRGAHCVAYELGNGPIPPGMEVDHRCHTRDCPFPGPECPHRRCVNPAHLKAVSPKENVLRNSGPSAMHAEATHCIHGHEFTEANTYRNPDGSRSCRACTRKTDAPHNRLKTHCKHGHPFDAANTRITRDGKRDCRACHREHVRRSKARKREAAA